MIDQKELDKLRDKLKSKLLTRRTQSEQIGMDYPGYTKFLNGGPIGEKNFQRCMEWLNEQKEKLK
jgi:hypothetical protein